MYPHTGSSCVCSQTKKHNKTCKEASSRYQPVSTPEGQAGTVDYLTNHSHYVGTVSDRVICSVGVPQGTVLAPFHFMLHRRLQTSFTRLSSAEVLWWSWIIQRTKTLWTGASGTTSSSMLGKIRSWWWTSTDVPPTNISKHPGKGHWDGDIIQVSGCSPKQQTALDSQHHNTL